ncbi:MAG: ATP-binding protein [Phycisphaerales bacterium JB059]
MTQNPDPQRPDPSLYERLGVFYLGRELSNEGELGGALLYDSRDLTTHAVCVGMTGSGKTGLCVSLLEEAAIDGVPAICIDPKGDLGNLLLTFPELRGEDFRPWIDEADARRKGMTPDAYAASRAELWRNGLADWGESGARIRKLRESAEFALYTPGSSAGRRITPLSSLAAPAKAIREDGEALLERVGASASGLLALLGLDTDPITSREHILVSTILADAWAKGQSLDFGELIRRVQSPPVEKIGVMGVDAFMSEKERGKLAMTINNLLASPGFAGWMEGEALDVQRLLRTREGKPRISILSIAHLSEPERQFFVTLLLGVVIAWMRRQPGTGSLRAILYMDEVFGYFPPTANPPTKPLLLTLMKQARAYGLGCVLATQNPVDLDYKGLSNAGTWLLGRLSTERDKMRVLDGLEGADGGTGIDRRQADKILSSLRPREFLMQNVHEDGAVQFRTRWAMSYLRGPMTREEIKRLTPEDAPEQRAPAPMATVPAPAPEALSSEPIAPMGVEMGYVPLARSISKDDRLVYRPGVLCSCQLHHVRVAAKIDQWEELELLALLDEGQSEIDWEGAVRVEGLRDRLEEAPDSRGSFEAIPGAIDERKDLTKWKRGLSAFAYREHARDVLHCKRLKAYSALGETREHFRVRLGELLREERDEALDKVRDRYASKLATMEDRVRRAEQKVEVERDQYKRSGLDTLISAGSGLLGALLGRKKVSVTNARRAGSAASKAARTGKERGDIERAEESLAALRERYRELELEFDEAIAEIESEMDVDALTIEAIRVSPRKGDMSPADPVLVWAPFRVGGDGRAEAAFETGT